MSNPTPQTFIFLTIVHCSFSLPIDNVDETENPQQLAQRLHNEFYNFADLELLSICPAFSPHLFAKKAETTAIIHLLQT